MLTDLVEIHFIELTKYRNLISKNYKEEVLHRWLTFLQKDVSDDVLKELMEMEPAIKMAEKKLDFLSSDPETLEVYKAREYSLHERANMINSAVEQGIEQGKVKEKYEVAKKLVLAGVAIDIIVATTGLDKEKIEKLK